jgi:hypothetical protein
MATRHVRLTFDVHIAEWRIDDPLTEDTWWSLEVFDQNLGTWIRLADCTRPGESYSLVHLQDLGIDEPPE